MLKLKGDPAPSSSHKSQTTSFSTIFLVTGPARAFVEQRKPGHTVRWIELIENFDAEKVHQYWVSSKPRANHSCISTYMYMGIRPPNNIHRGHMMIFIVRIMNIIMSCMY